MISFTRLKETVSLQEVARDYQISLKLMGQELIGPCPLHGGDNPTAFHLNSHKNRWKCFTRCGHGDVIDFVSRMEHCSLKTAAERIAQRYAPQLGLDIHPFLSQRGFKRETLTTFGISYGCMGQFKGMITIPLHDSNGHFAGYLGRRLSNLHKGKYYIQRGVKRSHILYNLHRIDPSRPVFVTEGPFDVLRLFQAGYPNAIALLGIQLSKYQESILPNKPVLLFDNDEAGRAASAKLATRLNIQSISLPGKDPAAMADSSLQRTLSACGFHPFHR